MATLAADLEAVRVAFTYRHIESTAPLGCSALYATSGAGKTRSVFEFLSHTSGSTLWLIP